MLFVVKMGYRKKPSKGSSVAFFDVEDIPRSGRPITEKLIGLLRKLSRTDTG